MTIIQKAFALTVIGFLTASLCNAQTEKPTREPHSVSNELEKKKKQSAQKMSAEKQKIAADGIKAVAESGILKTAKNKGDKAPLFALNNAQGKSVALKELLKRGPVVLTWYRGGWCPYCNIALHYLQEDLPLFQALGASLVALTPELPDKSLSTIERNHLKFEVLSDVGNKIAKEYGLAYRLTPEVAKAYQQGFDLHAYNGDESDMLPLAATYVIDKKGVIRYAFLDADYKNRADSKDIIAALKKLK